MPSTSSDKNDAVAITDGAPHHNDFVIRDGFPALRKPHEDSGVVTESAVHNNWSWWIDESSGQEPIQQHPVWVHDRAFSVNVDGHSTSKTNETAVSSSTWQQLCRDCETVFTARAKDDGAAYSAGTTYFLPCQMPPRCGLEAVVQSIFQLHVSHLDPRVYAPEQSGAEWWTLVLDDEISRLGRTKETRDGDATDDEEDEEDEVGLHFDADYGLEDQAPNLLLHPRLATVTYLTNYGAPTVVFDRRSPHPSDTTKDTLAGSIPTAWISHPRLGKHLAFDGRLLHGAPTTYFPATDTTGDGSLHQHNGLAATDDKNTRITEDQSRPLKKARIVNENERVVESYPQDTTLNASTSRKRITLLVNIWLNHCPLDAEPLDDEIYSTLETPWKKTKSSNLCSEGHVTSSASSESTGATVVGTSKPFEPTVKSSSDVTAGGSVPHTASSLFQEMVLPITWNMSAENLGKQSKWSSRELSVAANGVTPAGIDESAVICGHVVRVHYGSSMKDLHDITSAAAQCPGGSIQVNLAKNAIRLEIGELVESSDDDD